MERPKISKVTKSPARKIVVLAKVMEAEQAADAKAKALRLYCRALIRLYLKDNSQTPENGTGLGIL